MIRRVISALVMTVVLASLAGSAIFSAHPPAAAGPTGPPAFAGGAVAAVGAVATAPTVAARFGCSISLPPGIWVDRAHTLIPASLQPDCVLHGTAYASWDVRHSRYGASNIFIFDGKRSVTNGIYDWEPSGTYYVEPRNSWNAFWDLTQNTRSYVVKYGSAVSVSAVRSGRYLKFDVWATNYRPAVRAYHARANAKVVLQYKDKACRTCAWKYRRTLYTASDGKATTTFYSLYTRYYRVVSAGTAQIWSRSSSTIGG